ILCVSFLAMNWIARIAPRLAANYRQLNNARSFHFGPEVAFCIRSDGGLTSALPCLRFYFPRVDDWHSGGDKGRGISRRYGESMYGCNCGNLTVCHRDEAAASPSPAH